MVSPFSLQPAPVVIVCRHLLLIGLRRCRWMIDKEFSEGVFRDLCRKAKRAANTSASMDSLTELRRLVYQRAGVGEPVDSPSIPAEISRMNQILTVVEMAMSPPFPVRRVILEELFHISGPLPSPL
jgi:hypothetical protein